MNVVFMDIDGVLNSEQFALDRERKRLAAKASGESSAHYLLFEHNIDPQCVARLNTIIEATEAKIVVSSTWRKVIDAAEILRILRMHGFKGEIVGHTPDAWRDEEMNTRAAKRFGGYPTENGMMRPFVEYKRQWAQRGHEIAEWLRRNEERPLVHPEKGPQRVASFIILDDDTDMAHLVDRHIHTGVDVGLCDSDVERAIKLMATPWTPPQPGDPL